MNNRIIKLIALALINAISYHLAYIIFLHEVFEYAGFRYEIKSNYLILWTYFIAIFPILIVRKSNSLSSMGCVLIYSLSYVPIQMTLAFMWVREYQDLILAQAVMVVSMTALFWSAADDLEFNGDMCDNSIFFNPSFLVNIINVLTVIGLMFVLYEYRTVLKFVSFEDVYDLRSESSAISVSIFSQYFMMWLTYLLGPFYIARALIMRRRIDLVVGIFIGVVVYSASGSKIALLTPLLMMALNYINNDKGDFAVRFLATTSILVLSVALFVPNDGIFRWINSLFLLRLYGSNGWTAAVYYEYFSANYYTYYTHISPINAIFGGYPYGQNSLGQEISSFYFPDGDANFNAGFWASDGFAALGVIGVPLVTIFLIFYMRLVDFFAKGYSKKFLNLWWVGFLLCLMNVPFTTSLLSGGGLLFMIFLWFGKFDDESVRNGIKL